jgi:DNA-binding NtrC family response regulator
MHLLPQAVALLPCDILIVDDDPTLCSMLTDFLKRCGYIVQSAKDGRAAIKMIERHQVQLVITDLFMPEVDGFELILHLRKAAPKLKILAMSGDGLSDLDPFMTAVRHLGVLHTLTKPFSLTDLAGVVRKAIGEAL